VNGVHDMGGLDGFGPIPIERTEPVFHAEWEGRVWAIFLSLLPRLRGFRHAMERIPPAVYLTSSYYERWLNALITSLVERELLKREELISRGADPIALSQPAADLKGILQTAPRKRARFGEDDRVVVRNINPIGHTRLPRYVRGKRGVIHRDWGIYVFPDSSVHNGGEREQHVYSVSFKARELWGDGVPPRDTVRIDLWEDYLDADLVGARATKKKAKPARRRKR
jgi:nitrile hydratase subunit beta